MADLLLRLIGEDAASGAFDSVAGAVKKTAAVMYDFAKESAKLYAEAERGQRQFRLAAGDATEALNRQIEVMKAKYAVDDDDIRHMDTLLLRYGAAPAAIKGTTEAVLDYAAATGKDATQAMEMLIRGVESGTGSLGKMGVHFKASGDFAKDLATAVDALNEKFGGAGEEDAKGLAGRARKVSQAFDDLKKTFGSWFDQLDQRYGVLDKMAGALKRLNDEAMRPKRQLSGKQQQAQEMEEMFAGPKATGLGAVGALYARGAFTMGPEYDPEAMAEGGGHDHEVGKQGGGGGFHASALQLEASYQRQHRAVLIQAYERDLQDQEDHDDDMLKAHRKVDEDRLAQLALVLKAADESEAEATKAQLARLKESLDDMRKLTDVSVSNLTNQKQMYANAGMQLGSAFADALGRAMEGSAEDTEEIMLDLMVSLATIAGGVIGGVAGEGNPAAVQAGTMIGGLAGRGVKALYKHNKKHHDGSWIERYHGGGWMGLGGDEVPFIGQVGERVLSRQQVSNMGGPAAVDSLARGGGSGMHIHMSAIDTRSSREFFENDGGRGFYNALRTGRGSLTQLLGSSR